ncbi:FAD-dependent oxidoreductase [Streptomyces olivoreticuli]|uniref:FAD-dependent oxidoreductase n=1 Tax=Streptomyces olivoreticuli TaxID=68246 RepID=UPI002658F45F|nr:FAD-dependent oxidoreductase [Streptomyces olivoreticuli]WKK23616.1 FAD-dependent oxidoreductase [Streptomyces olivoreticuli]
MNYDVVVAGAGPVGLMLACELRLAGVDVLVVERLTEVDTTVKAGAINSPTAEALYRRGLLPELEEIQRENLERFASFTRQRMATDGQPPARAPKFAGHFAGIMLSGDLLDEADPDLTAAGPAGEVGFIPQISLELLLARRAAELGVELRRGVELTGLDAADDHVTVHLGDETVRAGWLVGCDGGRSTVRKLAGFDFPGTAPGITGRQAVVEMEGSERLKTGWNWTPTGTYAHGPVPGRILTVEFDGPPADRDTPVTAEELQTSLRTVSGVDDVTVTRVHSATRFTDNARQASDYRKGRVLLAGDAAHVHSPFGGQGLNLGIGDAVNLGWKLAATVRGRAPEGLLDTYTTERHPIGAWVLQWTRAQVALMRPESHASALRDVVAELTGTVDATTYFVKKISGVWQCYDIPGNHPLVGRSAPDLELADGSRLADHLHDGRGVLLDLAGSREARGAAEGRVKVVTARSSSELGGLLVRPDGIVAWAAASDVAAALPDLDAALARWFVPHASLACASPAAG